MAEGWVCEVLFMDWCQEKELSTSLKELYVSHLHTSLRLDCPVLHGVTGSGSMKHSQHWTCG